MSLPSYQQLMFPVLQFLCQRREEVPVNRLEEAVAKVLRISSEDLERRVPNGRRSVYSNRINWARSYLLIAKLIEIPRPGYCRGTDRGRILLSEELTDIDFSILDRYFEFKVWRERCDPEDRELYPDVPDSLNHQVATHFDLLNIELAREIIKRVYAFPPSFFERLIIDLLIRMGYGGGRVEMGRAIGGSGDGGVDGVIKEDALGLDVLYVQAKRLAHENGVPLREVRDFVGGLEGHRATKGVFVTTSYFPPTAYEFITRVSRRVVLIDGPELANLMIQHRVGVRVKETYEVKRIDEDYFV